MLVFDVTDKNSFENLIIWKQKIDDYAPKNIVTNIIGNKIDKKDRKISEEEAQERALKMDTLLSFTSAKEDDGVEEAFEKIC